MRENGLIVIKEVAHLITNKNSFFEKKSEILEFYNLLKKAVKSYD